MGAAILKIDKEWELLNAVEPVQKHVNKCEQSIVPENNAIILLKLRHEWHTTISV